MSPIRSRTRKYKSDILIWIISKPIDTRTLRYLAKKDCEIMIVWEEKTSKFVWETINEMMDHSDHSSPYQIEILYPDDIPSVSDSANRVLEWIKDTIEHSSIKEPSIGLYYGQTKPQIAIPFHRKISEWCAEHNLISICSFLDDEVLYIENTDFCEPL